MRSGNRVAFILCVCWLAAVAAPAADVPAGDVPAGDVQLHGRIAGKAGAERIRRWRLEIGSDSANTVTGVQIGAVRFRQTSTGAGSACTPAITSPASFPMALANIPPGGSASATLTIDFAGCDNHAQFTVEVELSGDGGARGIIQRRNDYR